jgi:CRP-like cAMP-binding protein
MPLTQNTVRNRLLTLLPASDFAALATHLQPVELPQGKMLAHRDEPIESVYFLDTGIGSIIAVSPEGQGVEAGLLGRDGFTPSCLVLGATRSPFDIVVQVAGSGYVIAADAFSALLNASQPLRSLSLRYTHVLAVQTAFTALSNGIHHIDERLARWLLMCDDRSGGGELALTHEYIALMLAVRRSSVTTALHALEGNRFITAHRGGITIRDRAGLEEFARDAYGPPEQEYSRLIGSMN